MMTPVRVEHGDGLCGPTELLCPRCGGWTLHHGAVDVYCRDAEDGDGVLTSVNGEGLHRKRVPACLIPGRRDSLRVWIECEECGPVGYLELRQHKGTTQLLWGDDVEEGDDGQEF